MGHCPLQTLSDTRKVVDSLEFLTDCKFPRNIVPSAVRIGKSHQASRPKSTGTVPNRANEIWHVDTVGPMKTTSVLGYRYNTTFTRGIRATSCLMAMPLRPSFRYSGTMVC